MAHHPCPGSRLTGYAVLEASQTRFDSDLVVDGLSQSLFTTEIFFCGLHRDVAQKELNLLQLAASTVTQSSTRSSKVMRREFQDPSLARVLFDDMPHHLFG